MEISIDRFAVDVSIKYSLSRRTTRLQRLEVNHSGTFNSILAVGPVTDVHRPAPLSHPPLTIKCDEEQMSRNPASNNGTDVPVAFRTHPLKSHSKATHTASESDSEPPAISTV